MKISNFLLPFALGMKTDRNRITDDIFYPVKMLEKLRFRGVDTSLFQVAENDSGKNDRGLQVSTKWDVLTPEGLLG